MRTPLASFSQAAQLAYRSLTDHPDLNTPEAIANGPYSLQQIDTPDIVEGLRELEAEKWAVETFGGWQPVAE
jgi:hypothetical protein